MRTSRLIAGLLSAGLLGLTPVAVSAPAGAATTYATQATLTPSATAVQHGDTLTMNGAITTTAGGSVYYGSATLMVSTVKSPTWTVVEVDETAGSYFFFDVRPDSNAIYKVVYSGSSSTNGDVWSPSESLPVTVGVQRKVTASTRGHHLLRQGHARLHQEAHQGRAQVRQAVAHVQDHQDRRARQVAHQAARAEPQEDVLALHRQGRHRLPGLEQHGLDPALLTS